MIRMTIAALICASLVACSAQPVAVSMVPAVEPVVEQPREQPDESQCPPLPKLPAGATQERKQLFTLTLIALYQQCAESKK